MDAIDANIAENIKRVRAAIAEAAVKSGRAPGDVALVAASKTKPAASVRLAIAAGVDAVGENRVQEMAEKYAQGAYSGAPLHLIGHLQSNKINKVVGVCGLIESVGSLQLLEQIGKRAAALGLIQDVLMEVNIGCEPQKTGILPQEAERTLEMSSRIAGVRVLGLMSVPPVNDETDTHCNYFDAMHKLFVDMSGKKYDNISMRILSMGMSDSYADAIKAGSNMVRIGSAIFGAR